MKRLAVVLLSLPPILLASCAKSYVAPRNAGRVDAARSVTTYSDEQWKILREPASDPDAER